MINKIARLLPKSLFTIEQQRQLCLEVAPEGALKDYLSVPFPDKNATLNEFDVLSLDFETTGMNAVNDQLLSIGCVNMHQGKIQLSSCAHQIIRTKGKLNKNNVVIHQITDSEKNGGADLKQSVDTLLRLMTGKVLLVHFAKIERTFLQEACKQIYGVIPPFLMIDTLALVKRRYDLKDINYDPSYLRLSNLRERFKLPNYYAHNALKDAIATGELLLAELYKHHDGMSTPLKKLV